MDMSMATFRSWCPFLRMTVASHKHPKVTTHEPIHLRRRCADSLGIPGAGMRLTDGEAMMYFRGFDTETLAKLAALQKQIDDGHRRIAELEREREAIYQADYDLFQQERR